MKVMVKMNRLTIRNSDGSVSQPTSTTVESVFYKLADYEDIGFDPDEMKKLVDGEIDKFNNGGWAGILSKLGMHLEVCDDPQVLKKKLEEYEALGMTPAELQQIVDRYGHGKTLRTSCAERLAIIKDIPDARLKEIARAERQGKLTIRAYSGLEVCGNCVHFKRDGNTAHGVCDCREEKNFKVPLSVVQSRKRCKDDFQLIEEEKL